MLRDAVLRSAARLSQACGQWPQRVPATIEHAQAQSGRQQSPHAEDRAADDDQRHDEVLARSAPSQPPPSGERDVVGDERRDVRQREQVAGHDQRIAPGVGFALHDRQGREALRREHVPGQQRRARSRGSSCARSRAPARRRHRSAADIAYTVPSALTATSRAARPGHQRDRDLPVEADGREQMLAARGRACPRCCTRSAGPVAPAGGAGKLARNHSTTISVRMMRADAAQEDPRALPQAEQQIAQVRPAVLRQLQHAAAGSRRA